MGDETDIEEQAEVEDAAPVAGERLAAARRELQIPVLEIAKELHLDEYKVHALERNEFDVIGAPVFAKGHLKKYAQLVNVAEADVMADYYHLDRRAATPLLISTRKKPRREISPGPWLAAITAVALVGVAYWWFLVRVPVEATPETGIVAPLPASGALTSDVETETAVQSELVDTPVDATEQDVDEPEEQVSPQPLAQAVVATGPAETRLSVTYSGDCWTEITDAGGSRLFFDLGKAGRTVNLSGEAPFNVLFGNATNVSIAIDGRPYEIPVADRRGRTARLTINGS